MVKCLKEQLEKELLILKLNIITIYKLFYLSKGFVILLNIFI